jgi:hypothetical protein
MTVSEYIEYREPHLLFKIWEDFDRTNFFERLPFIVPVVTVSAGKIHIVARNESRNSPQVRDGSQNRVPQLADHDFFDSESRFFIFRGSGYNSRVVPYLAGEKIAMSWDWAGNRASESLFRFNSWI